MQIDLSAVNIFKKRKQPDNIEMRSRGVAYTVNQFFNGEKDVFGMPPAYDYNVDYYTMATHANNLYITNEFAQLAVNRFVQFMVGSGLDLYPTPKKDFLKQKFNVKLPENFIENVKDLWELFCTETDISANKQWTLHQIMYIAAVNAEISGDVLIVRRVVDGQFEIQLIDGRNVKSSKLSPVDSENKIIDGVEVNKKGEHIAFYVQEDDGIETRILARDKDGHLYAWLCYASCYRLGSTRGYSPLGSIMQKLNQIGEFAESEVLSANISAKFVATIDQDGTSTGVNPTNKMIGTSSRVSNIKDIPADDKNPIEKIVTGLRRMTNGIVMHMPRGQKLNTYKTDHPNTNYGNFLDTNMQYITASRNLPYEVALMRFQSNFSASRAAMKMFEFLIAISRQFICINGFYKPVYEGFFELEVLKGNLEAPKFLELRKRKGYADNAYLMSKFIGSPIPHIDPVKEVNAVVTKLKNGLTTFETALQELGSKADFNTMCEKLKKEIKALKDCGIEIEGITEILDDEQNDERNNKDE